MLQEVHPIQAALTPIQPPKGPTTEKYCGPKSWCVGCCCIGPFIYLCPIDGRTVLEYGGEMPKEYVEAKFNLQALGLEPAVIFPGGAIAPTGLKMQKEDPSVPSDPAFSELFHHPIFDGPHREYKPSPADSAVHYYNAFLQTIVEYTICLPLTVAQKTNSCGCRNKMEDDKLEVAVTGLVAGIVSGLTEKPYFSVRRQAVKLFHAGCWHGPTLVGALAPLINETVNDGWVNVRRNTYLGTSVWSGILQAILEAPGFTPEFERALVVKIKQLALQKCVMCCNAPDIAWRSEKFKDGAKQIAKLVIGKIGGEVASSMI